MTSTFEQKWEEFETRMAELKEQGFEPTGFELDNTWMDGLRHIGDLTPPKRHLVSQTAHLRFSKDYHPNFGEDL